MTVITQPEKGEKIQVTHLGAVSGVWGSLFKNEKLEALQGYSVSLKAAGGPPGESAMDLRSMELSEEVRQPPHLAAYLTILL